MIVANDFQRQWGDIREATLQAVDAVGESGWYILGSEVSQFEAALAEMWGRKHAIGVASGLDALEICLRSLGCGPGDKVLTTPISAFATTLAIAKIGAVPVFVDCDSYGLIDLARCEAVLDERPDIRFLVPVHLYGHSLDLHRLASLAERYNVRVVEDCAQSILASRAGRLAGTVGVMSATSFYPTKNLGALGDGGAILTDDDDLAGSARVLRDYGQSGKYRHAVIGYNSRLDELQAAILRRVQLPRLQAWTRARRAAARAYMDGISHPEIRVPGPPESSDSCWHLFPVFVDPEKKPGFMSHLRQAGVMTAEHYPAAIVDQPALGTIETESIDDCSTARTVCASQVSLPIHPYLRSDEIEFVIRACNDWKS